MKCPFIVPVEKEVSYQDRRGEFFRIIDVAKCTIVSDLREDVADFLVQAINSHDKLSEALDEIEAVSCGEQQIESDGVYDDSDGMLWIYKRIQALKESEKK